MIELPKASSNPRAVYEDVLNDLLIIFRAGKVPDKMVEGARLAMALAFQLGEQAGRNKGWAE